MCKRAYCTSASTPSNEEPQRWVIAPQQHQPALLYPLEFRQLLYVGREVGLLPSPVKTATTHHGVGALSAFFWHNERNMTQTTLELRLLGVPTLSWQGQVLTLQNRHLALICYLALQAKPCPRDTLTELLWGPGRSGNLRTALYNLRRLSGANAWLVDSEVVEVRSLSDVDALKRARDDTDALVPLKALEADADDLLLGLKAPTAAYAEWLEEQRGQVSELIGDLLERAARSLLELGQYSRARAYTERLVHHNPLDETAYGLLMRIEHESGHSEDIPRILDRLRTALAAQLGVGVEPAPETLTLYRRLLGMSSSAQGVLLRLGDSVPGRATQLFGRQALLARLDAEVRAHPVLLHGFGGVGKTALAAELAVGRLPEGDVLWLQAGMSDGAELADAVQRALGVQGAQEALQKKLRRLVLAVVDDVWSDAAVSAIRALLAGVPLVVTSRQRFKEFMRLDVGSLPRHDARELLSVSVEQPLDESDAERICELLGDHPFALRLAGAKLRRDQLSTPQLLAQIANAPHTLRAPSSWYEEGSVSVEALLKTSLEALSDDAYDAFLAVGALASPSATAELLARCLRYAPERTEAALIELHTYALAERTARPGSDMVRYILHDLSHAFARQNTTLRPKTVVRAFHAFVAAYVKDFEVLDAERSNLVGALEAAHDAQDRRTFVDLMAFLSVGDAYFAARGHSLRSLKLLAVAVGWAKELGELERAHHFVTKLGDAHRVLYHDYARSLKAYQEGVRLAQLIKDPSREAILTSLCGVALHHLGLPPDEAFERASVLARREDDKLVLGQILQHRGYVAGFHEDWQAVERLNQEAVEVARALCHSPEVDQARARDNLFFSLLNLGEAKRMLGSFEEAVAHRVEALELATAHDNQLWRAYALHELGEMYRDARRPQEAEPYLREALTLYEANGAQAKVEQVQGLLGGLDRDTQKKFTPR